MKFKVGENTIRNMSCSTFNWFIILRQNIKIKQCVLVQHKLAGCRSITPQFKYWKSTKIVLKVDGHGQMCSRLFDLQNQ